MAQWPRTACRDAGPLLLPPPVARTVRITAPTSEVASTWKTKVSPPAARKIGGVLHRVRDHQVDVEGEVGSASNRLNEGGSEGNIGDEMAIHHVQMEGVSPPALGLPDRGGQVPKIRAQERRGQTPSRSRFLHGVAIS